jgi:hypothetical protein
MTQDIVTNIGEEWLIDEAQEGATLTVLLYDDSTDAIGESDDLSAITTEPGGSAYARQSDTIATLQISGDYGFDNDNKISFDVSDSSSSVDTVGYVANFDSSVAGDGGTASDHLVATAALSQTRDLSNYDTIDISAGDLDLTVS